ncbi:hypothetical protein GGR58DRAFT_527122 [Xylaria digitata]|nr:hypothetical protein GGR58DRAFT_527122 [Xylaria digitata]
MAIIQGLPGVEVTIYTNRGTTKEYDDPSHAEKVQGCPQVITKYVECGDDELFGIHLKATKEYSWGPKNHVLNFSAAIDGIWNPNDRTGCVVQGFAFSKLARVDRRQTGQHDIETKGMERLGTIKIKVYRMVLEKGNGAFLAPIDDQPEEFVVCRGESQTHGIKFTNSQPATKPKYIKSSKLSEDNGPIAIFRFKYRSREALSLEGITSERRNNNENNDSQPCNSRPNQRSSPSGSRQPKAKIEKGISHSRNTKSAPPPRLKHSAFSHFQPSRSRVKRRVRNQNNTKAKGKDKMMKNSCRITDEDAEQLVDDLISAMYDNYPARFAAIKLESEDEDLSSVKIESDSEDGDKDKHHRSSIVRANDNHDKHDVTYVQEMDTSRNSWSSDTIRPSIEKYVPRIETTTGVKAKAKKLPHHLKLPDPEVQSVKELPPNTKRERRTAIKHHKSRKHRHEHRRRGMDRLRGLRRKFNRVSNGATKDAQSHHPVGNNPTTAATATGTNSDKGVAAKRKLRESIQGLRPFKISKTSDLIDLVDSD